MLNLKERLRKTRDALVNPLKGVFARRALSDVDAGELEELLYSADIGVEATERIMESLRAHRGDDPRAFLRDQFLELLKPEGGAPAALAAKPRCIIVVGVNGVGKTTSIAKLAAFLTARGESVILAACDTFRAAAVDQLSVWADRVGVPIISQPDGSDPAAVAFDACRAAKTRGADVVIVDTAGRLHTRVNLMEELAKIRRVCEKALGEGAVETLLVLDANLGQNSLIQAQQFTEKTTAEGIILTKLDSTARGGIVIAIRQTLGMPVRYIGVGEQMEDFAEFDAEAFVAALLE